MSSFSQTFTYDSKYKPYQKELELFNNNYDFLETEVKVGKIVETNSAEANTVIDSMMKSLGAIEVFTYEEFYDVVFGELNDASFPVTMALTVLMEMIISHSDNFQNKKLLESLIQKTEELTDYTLEEKWQSLPQHHQTLKMFLSQIAQHNLRGQSKSIELSEKVKEESFTLEAYEETMYGFNMYIGELETEEERNELGRDATLIQFTLQLTNLYIQLLGLEEKYDELNNKEDDQITEMDQLLMMGIVPELNKFLSMIVENYQTLKGGLQEDHLILRFFRFLFSNHQVLKDNI